MPRTDATYAVELGFTPASQVIPDADRPPLLRARPREATPYGDDGVEVHVCDAVDWAQDDTVQPDLFTFGFDRVDLADHDPLQAVLGEVHRSGEITDATAAAIRAALDGAVLRSASGRRLTVLYVADEGLIMRTGGPNGLSSAGSGSRGMNGHRPAVSIHGDQDVHGTPMAQLMEGRAPSLFRHDSPDGSNHDAALMLVNLWIPLHQITRPLVLGDGRSVDRARHQLRFGLATESFLERDEDQVVNDIWTFLHHPDQRWYFRSDMDQRSAYVFNTLSTPHGSTVLPGEDVAERCHLALEAVETAIERGDRAELDRLVAETDGIEVPDGAPPALRAAVAEMVAVLGDAGPRLISVGGPVARAWSDRSRAARARVVRTSVELRLVVSVDA